MVVIGMPQKSNFGVITATEVRTPVVNAPAGSLALEVAGVSAFSLSASYATLFKALKLWTTTQIVDDGGVTLLDPDDAGAIAGLARIDGPVTLASEAQEMSLAPVDVVRDLSVGTPDYERGSIEYNASVSVDIGLTDLLISKRLGSRVKLESMIIYGWTTNINTYLSEVELKYHSQTGAVDNQEWNDATDYGNGSINAFTAPYTINKTLGVDRLHRLVLDIVNGGGTLSIWSIEIKYTLLV